MYLEAYVCMIVKSVDAMLVKPSGGSAATTNKHTDGYVSTCIEDFCIYEGMHECMYVRFEVFYILALPCDAISRIIIRKYV